MWKRFSATFLQVLGVHLTFSAARLTCSTVTSSARARQVVKEYVHDPNAFTQGLEYDTDCSSGACQEVYWESTGAQQGLRSDLG